MRHKQRPVKSSRSVTFVIDGHTSFGDSNATQNEHNQQNIKHHHKLVQPIIPSASSSNSSSQQQQHHHYHNHKQQRTPTSQDLYIGLNNAGASSSNRQYHQHNNNTNNNNNHRQQPHSRSQTETLSFLNDDVHDDDDDDDAGELDDDDIHQQQQNQQQHNINKPLMRKQFEHNRHMSDVMRLAFLENNDISIEDCSNIDFNSLSTASILQRNIQQHLQQQRRDQLQLRQQQQQQQRFHHQQRFQQHKQFQFSDSYGRDLVDEDDEEREYEGDNVEDDNIDDYDNDADFEITDSRIFATATPTSSQRPQDSSYGSRVPRPLGKGRVSTSTGKKGRGKDSSSQQQQQQRAEFSNDVQVETIQRVGDGFLCDEPGCGKSFPSLRKLRHHKVVHSDDFPFVCEFHGCAKKFKRKFGIDLHSTTHFDLDPGMYSKTSNNSSLPFFGRRMQYSMCKQCNQKFRTVHEYQYHMLKHGKEPFKCPVKGCGQTFGIWKSFQKHRASHYFNYYCKMDPRCDHSTSNLQLLKLHIYCCHFRRKLPENATLASRDQEQDQAKEELVNVEDADDSLQPENDSQVTEYEQEEPEEVNQVRFKQEGGQVEAEESLNVEDTPPPQPKKPVVETPRRDSRLRKNPPRSSAFGQQDYAAVNNGSRFTKSLASTPTLKRSRASMTSSGSQSVPPAEKKTKLPPKVLPKRSAQRLPMSMLDDDASTEDDDVQQEQQRFHQQQRFQFNDSYGRDLADDDEEREYEDDNVEDDNIDDYDNDADFEITDSRIFATATPTSSQRPQDSSYGSRIPRPLGKSGMSTSGGSTGKKGRGKDSSSQQLQQQREEFSNDIQIETIQRVGDGFLCDESGCGKSFPSLRKLRHHKVVHSDDFPFVCEFHGCAKKFKRKFGIDLHSTTHFDLDPDMYRKTSNNSSLPFFGRRMQYSMCKQCSQKFRTVHEYQYHMLKHGKEPFKCPVKGCGQTFGIWKSFQKHRASHYFNYYCKMDPSCDHSTSNLQLLKLHIYCCHFRRKLPENATLASRDQEEDPAKEELVNVEYVDDSLVSQPENDSQVTEYEQEEPEEVNQSQEEPELESPHQVRFKQEEGHIEVEESLNVEDTPPPPPQPEKPVVETPRRDSRLRKNPPRSSAFGQQDYAAVNNGSRFTKSLASTPTLKRSRASMTSSGSQSVPPAEKKTKLPPKVLPKRSAQRLPMSMIDDDASTEDDDVHSSEEGGDFESMHNDTNEDDEGDVHDPSQRNKFKCHLCDYKFSVRFQLTKHLSTHLELTPEMYSATADKQVVQLSERRRREFYCDKCNVKFEQMSELDNHMRKHGNRPYVCSFCQVSSTFRLAKQYLSHLYEHRFNYKCTMEPGCDFTINRKDALKLHIFRMHLNQQLPSYIENFANMIE